MTDRDLLEELSAAASSNGGIRITPTGHLPSSGHMPKAERSPAPVDAQTGRRHTVTS